jgi:hypothetical protein
MGVSENMFSKREHAIQSQARVRERGKVKRKEGQRGDTKRARERDPGTERDPRSDRGRSKRAGCRKSTLQRASQMGNEAREEQERKEK